MCRISPRCMWSCVMTAQIVLRKTSPAVVGQAHLHTYRSAVPIMNLSGELSEVAVCGFEASPQFEDRSAGCRELADRPGSLKSVHASMLPTMCWAVSLIVWCPMSKAGQSCSSLRCGELRTRRVVRRHALGLSEDRRLACLSSLPTHSGGSAGISWSLVLTG
jgi:hypothetical protein